MERAITKNILNDLDKKIVFITGPRQVGKTTLAKSLNFNYDYFNFDNAEDRLILRQASWNRNAQLVIFDELHKMIKWKCWLKGVYDTERTRPRLLVTGSAKLNTYKKVGDSLAGRYFQFRLHPFDIKEAKTEYTAEEAFSRLWNCSGFPEPFVDGSQIFYHRWRKSHLDIILRQDLIDIQTIRDIKAMEDLIELLKNNIGSTISFANLARALEKDAKTIKRWLQLLEDLYVIFRVTPYADKISRSLLKEPKYYFYDCMQVSKNDGLKLENIIASAILKELHFLEDVYGATTRLHFVRTKDGKEIDFLALINNKPYCLIESKWADDEPSKNFSYFKEYFTSTKKIQLVKEIRHEKTFAEGLEVRNAITWLANIDFHDAINY